MLYRHHLQRHANASQSDWFFRNRYSLKIVHNLEGGIVSLFPLHSPSCILLLCHYIHQAKDVSLRPSYSNVFCFEKKRGNFRIKYLICLCSFFFILLLIFQCVSSNKSERFSVDFFWASSTAAFLDEVCRACRQSFRSIYFTTCRYCDWLRQYYFGFSFTIFNKRPCISQREE